ncbi:MAG: hypothetical protein NT086_21190 [Proteobacteria bacterium]|nr:hypothetical protein [Pseudomonadota bacterium]
MKNPFITGVATATPKKAKTPLFKALTWFIKCVIVIAMQQIAVALAIEDGRLQVKKRHGALSFVEQGVKA